jgi:AMP phosphorylase
MPFFLTAKKLDFTTGGREVVAVFQEEEGKIFGIQPGDKVELSWRGATVVASANFSRHKVKKGEIGLFKELWQRRSIKEDEVISVEEITRPASVLAIRKKMLGKPLTYAEYEEIVRDIVDNRIGVAEITYFVASGFLHAYTNEELFFLTKAIAEHGDQLHFNSRIVADKHSVGGLAGNRTTMVVIPIIASCGLTIPKTSSRAITSPSGTADTMEVLAPVTLSTEKIRSVVKATGACLVWGGSVNLAPADDKIIHVSHPLSLEPYTKMVVSIMAKKVAMGVTHLVIDMPYGPTTKIPTLENAKKIKKTFEYLAKRFGIKLSVEMIEAKEPIGRGVGPALEARDVMLVLQQKSWRPIDLEKKAIRLAGKLLELTRQVPPGKGKAVAQEALQSGKALAKMRQIIKAQGGNADIDSEEIIEGTRRFRVTALRNGVVKGLNNMAIDEIARILGAPDDKKAGIYVHKRVGDHIHKGDRLLTFYSSSQDRERLARAAIKKMSIYSYT